MPEQLVFDLPVRPAMGRGDFFVSDANAGAVVQVEAWRDWPHGKLVLEGPVGSGKTHLCHVWAALTGGEIVSAQHLEENDLDRLATAPAIAVEGVDQIVGGAAEATLFHLHNASVARGAPLLLTARGAPGDWGLSLPDLESRMQQAGLARLGPPDDALLMAVLMKLAHDRALRISPRMLSHVVDRIERSFAALHVFVERLDTRALTARRPPTLSDAKAILAEMAGDVAP